MRSFGVGRPLGAALVLLGTLGMGARAAADEEPTARAASGPHIGELSGVTLEADRGRITADIEVEGELFATIEYQIRKAEAREEGLVLVGNVLAKRGAHEEELRGVHVDLSDPMGVCGELAATPAELVLEDLNIVVHAKPVELTFEAKTARGNTLTAMLCAAAHLVTEPEGPFVSATRDVLAVANRALKQPVKPVAAARPKVAEQATSSEDEAAPAKPESESAPRTESHPGSKTIVLPRGTKVEIRPATVEVHPAGDAPESGPAESDDR